MTKVAKNAARNAVRNAVNNVRTRQQAPAEPAALSETEREQLAELRKRERATAMESLKGFDGKVVKVIDGKKRVGETGNVLNAGLTKFSRKYVRIEFGSEVDFINNPDHLEIVGEQSAATKKRIKDANEASRSETLLIAAKIGRETEKAVRIDYAGWYASLWMPKSDVTKMDATFGEQALPIFEIAAWRVRKGCGRDAYDALVARQAELEKALMTK